MGLANEAAVAVGGRRLDAIEPQLKPLGWLGEVEPGKWFAGDGDWKALACIAHPAYADGGVAPGKP